MKYELTKKLTINCTLDSSEAIMFTKGGQHSIVIKQAAGYSDDEDQHIRFDFYDTIEVTFQMEKSQQGRFDHITSEAANHREFYAARANLIKPPTLEASSDPSHSKE